MAQPAPPLVTLREFMELPDAPPYTQLVEGDLLMSPPPFRSHEDVIRNLTRILNAYLETKPLGIVYSSSFGVYLNDINAYIPDLVFISNARIALLSDRGIDGAPDLVVEVLSPATERYDKGAKRIVYSRSGVRELWLIDPGSKQIDAFRFSEDPEAPVTSVSRLGAFSSPLFPGLIISCEKIFAGPAV